MAWLPFQNLEIKLILISLFFQCWEASTVPDTWIHWANGTTDFTAQVLRGVHKLRNANLGEGFFLGITTGHI